MSAAAEKQLKEYLDESARVSEERFEDLRAAYARIRELDAEIQRLVTISQTLDRQLTLRDARIAELESQLAGYDPDGPTDPSEGVTI